MKKRPTIKNVYSLLLTGLNTFLKSSGKLGLVRLAHNVIFEQRSRDSCELIFKEWANALLSLHNSNEPSKEDIRINTSDAARLF